MTNNILKSAAKTARWLRTKYFDPDAWLFHVSGVVHVGANTGQECQQYAQHDLDVLWIEPTPDIFQQLLQNIAGFPKQIAHQALLTDVAGQSVTFNISSNASESSSIFEMAGHKDIWPDVDYVERIELQSQTLDDVLDQYEPRYNALVMDTQGAELLVLKGGTAHLSQFDYISTEAADFNMYEGAATLDKLVAFLASHHFRLTQKQVMARTPDRKGGCYNVLFKRQKR